jgi:hypothetical protein
LAAVRRALAVLSLMPALLAVGGCGTREPSDEEQVRATLRALADGTRAKDYQRLCDKVFAKKLLDGITRIGLPCEVALRQAYADVRDPQLVIGRIQVSGNEASADVRSSALGQSPSSDTVRLVKADAGWRVSSLGDSSPGSAAPAP